MVTRRVRNGFHVYYRDLVDYSPNLEDSPMTTSPAPVHFTDDVYISIVTAPPDFPHSSSPSSPMIRSVNLDQLRRIEAILGESAE